MCLSRCLTFRQHPVKMAHLSTGSCHHVMSHVLVKVSHLAAAASQDGTSFDWFMSSCHVTCACQGVSPFSSSQSRWHIFRLVHVMSHALVKVSHLSAAASQDGTSFDWFMSCHMCLSRCLTFRKHPSQDGTSFDWFMSSCHVTCACQGVSPFGGSQSRWHIFRLVHVMSHVLVKVSHLSAAPQSRWHIFRLVHVIMSCHMCLSRCLTFRRQPVKMAHLSTGSCHVTCACQGVSPSAAPSQDGTSFDWFMSSCHVTCACQGVSPFGGSQSRWHIFRLVHVMSLCLSRCVTFRQHPVKMAHLSTGSCHHVMSHVLVKVSHILHSQEGTFFAVFSCVITCCLEAVHRFYESRRRLFNDYQPSRREKAGEVKKKCKKIVQQKKAKVHAYRITYNIFNYCCSSYTIIERRF